MGNDFQASFSESVDNFYNDIKLVFKKPNLIVSNYSFPSFFTFLVILLPEIYLSNIGIQYAVQIISLQIIFIIDQYLYCNSKGFPKPNFDNIVKDGSVTVVPIWIIILLLKTTTETLGKYKGNKIKEFTGSVLLSVVLFFLYNWTSNFRKTFGYDTCQTVTDLDIQRKTYNTDIEAVLNDKYKMFEHTNSQRTYEDINKSKSTAIVTTTILSTDGGLVPTNLKVTSDRENYTDLDKMKYYESNKKKETSRAHKRKDSDDDTEIGSIVLIILFTISWLIGILVILKVIHKKLMDNINDSKNAKKEPTEEQKTASQKQRQEFNSLTSEVSKLNENIVQFRGALNGGRGGGAGRGGGRGGGGAGRGGGARRRGGARRGRGGRRGRRGRGGR